MTQIWYFYPSFDAKQDGAIRSLLSRIQERWRIDHVLTDASGRDRQEALYQTYFAPPAVARVLSQRTGRRPEEALKRNRRAVYLRGVIALVETNDAPVLQWYAQGREATGFLERLQREGTDVIQQIYEEARQYGDFERMIVDAFTEEGRIPGTYLLKERVGKDFLSDSGERSVRFADAICVRRESPDWVFEVESELNYPAIGQALTYQFLYCVDNPSREARPGIVCASAPSDLVAVCRHLGIEVFVVDIDKSPRLSQEFAALQETDD